MIHLLHLRKSAPSAVKPSLLDNPLQSPHNKLLRAKRRAEAKQFRATQPPGIQRDTPLLPDVIAETICNQVANYLGLNPSSPLPTSFSSFSSVQKKSPVRGAINPTSKTQLRSHSGLRTQNSELPAPTLYSYIPLLTAKAEHCYTHHRQFRRLLRARGNDGRSALYMFMRHWLYAHLHQNHPQTAARLPKTFTLGHPLPKQT